MCPRRVIALLLFSLIPAVGFAGNAEWRKYAIPSTGANVDIPVNIFTEDAGQPEGGIGRRFFTPDHRADLTVQSVPNPEKTYLQPFSQKGSAGRYPVPAGDVALFRSVKHSQRRTWYNRCNRADQYMNCVLINYPAAEERQWDAVVTRISLSLAN